MMHMSHVTNVVHSVTFRRNLGNILVEQEAQLPQRNSASDTHDYLGWSADLLMITRGGSIHRTLQNRTVVLFLTFKRSQSKTFGRKRILTSNNQARSRTFILQLFAGQHRGSTSSYCIAGRICDVFEDIAC